LTEDREHKSWINASPKAITDFFYKCNSDHDFRAELLENPIKLLEENGIKVNPEAAKEISEIINSLLEQYEDIGVIPDYGESNLELLESGWGIVIKPVKELDPNVI
jgi:hypothetical protein